MNPKPFKRPPKKYEPKGLSILHEDRDIIVVDKVSGLLTVSTDRFGDQTAYRLLTDYVRKGNSKSKNRVFIVHRLDRDTSGILVFAKSETAKRFLQDEWKNFVRDVQAVDDDVALQIAQKYIHPEALLIVVVGDREKIESRIKELNLGPIHIVEDLE